MTADEDLSAFFAKKAQKSKDKKKKSAIHIEKLGHRLEKADQQETEQKARAAQEVADSQFLKSKEEGEDSEWLEYTDSNPMLAEDRKFKEMESTDTEVDEDYEEDVHRPAKTWNIPKPAESKNQQDKPTLTARKYIAPHLKKAIAEASPLNLLGDSSAFPSFDAAVKHEEQEKLKKKKEKEDQKKLEDEKKRQEEERKQREEAEAKRRQEEQEKAVKMKEGRYVPPHLRDK